LSPALHVLERVFAKVESNEESGTVSLALKEEHRATPRVCAPERATTSCGVKPRWPKV